MNRATTMTEKEMADLKRQLEERPKETDLFSGTIKFPGEDIVCVYEKGLLMKEIRDGKTIDYSHLYQPSCE